MRTFSLPCLLSVGAALLPALSQAAAPKSWPSDVREITYTSSGDRSQQPALFWAPADATGPRPLLVGLHTWSADFRQVGSSLPYLEWCKQQGWVFIHPNFRGRNRTPETLGSDLAVADIASAVEYAIGAAPVDRQRVYLIGVSGGGHMSLLMAGRHPEIWAGVSAWCPINDIGMWHRDCPQGSRFANYAKDIEAALGGSPATDPARADSARRRSPAQWLAQARSVPLDINAGVHDGRTGSVPFVHSLFAFNSVVGERAGLSPAAIAEYYRTQKLPAGWKPAEPDPLYGKRVPLFRSVSGNTRVTIFEGGHEIVHVAGLNWLAQQRKGRPAVWQIKAPVPLVVRPENTQSGK